MRGSVESDLAAMVLIESAFSRPDSTLPNRHRYDLGWNDTDDEF